MKKIYILLIVVYLLAAVYLYNHNKSGNLQVVNVYSSRKEELVRTIFDEFTKSTGIKVHYIIDDYAQLLSRMENNGEVDLFLTADVTNLTLVKNKNLLLPVDSEILRNAIPERFRDSEDYWFGLTKRARMLVYNKELVDPKELNTYENLANKRWKGKILVSSSTSSYNQSLIAFMIAKNGFEDTKKWATDIVKNMARKPSGGETNQIYAVAAGEGEVAIVNHYYLARILASEKKDITDKLGAFFPNQDNTGVMMNISGAAMTRNAKNKKNAVALLEFLVSKQAQELYAQKNQEYPIVRDIGISDILKSWGSYLESQLPLSTLGDHLANAMVIASESGWK